MLPNESLDQNPKVKMAVVLCRGASTPLHLKVSAEEVHPVWMPPFGGFQDLSQREEAPGQTWNSVEGL